MPKPYRTTLLASLLALICAGVLWAAYDWFQGRYLRAFSEHTAVFSGDPLQLPAGLAGPGAIRLVHFWDPACPCNVGNQQHLGELIEHFGPLGVEFYAVQKARQPWPTPRHPERPQAHRHTARRRADSGQPGGGDLGSQRQAGVLRPLQRRPDVQLQQQLYRAYPAGPASRACG